MASGRGMLRPAAAAAGRAPHVIPSSQPAASASPAPASRHRHLAVKSGGSSAGGGRSDRVNVLSDSRVFGSAPSAAEAEAVLSALKQVFSPFRLSYAAKDRLPSPLEKLAIDGPKIHSEMDSGSSLAGHESQRPEPSQELLTSHALQLHGSTSFHAWGLDKIQNSFDLLSHNPSVQRMVLSLATDAVVWEAIMKNEAVQELKKCFPAAGQSEGRTSRGDDVIAMIIRWILENARMKIVALTDKITNLVNELFHPRGGGKHWDILIDVVTSSFMLSVMVLVVVVIARIQGS